MNSNARYNDWIYNDIVREHFFNPYNVLSGEESYQADGVGLIGNPQCGDMIKVHIKVDSETKKIIDFKWKAYGCAAAIANTSMLSIMVTENGGMTIDEAYKIKPNDIADRLGGLPGHKIHCSVLGDQALRAAIEDYKRSGIK